MAKETSAIKIPLKSADGIVFEIEPAITKLINASTVVDPIPLPNVYSPQLAKIVDYLDQQSKGKYESKKEFEAEYLTGVDNDNLRELLVVVHYLDIEGLLELLTKAMANRIPNKSAEYVKKLSGVESDYTEEEEAKYREENAWVFQGVDEDED